MTESTERDQNVTPEEDVEGHRIMPGNEPNMSNADDDVEGHRIMPGNEPNMSNDDDDVEGHRIMP